MLYADGRYVLHRLYMTRGNAYMPAGGKCSYEQAVFPKGATELDAALVSQPLEWIAAYPKKIIFWKIYELVICPRNRVSTLPIKTEYLVNKDSFGSYVNSEKIVLDSVEERDRSCFFLRPNGDVFIPVLNHRILVELPLGNLLQDDVETINCLFDQLVNRSGYNKSFRFMKNFVEK